MGTFTGNTVASGDVIYAADHNTLVSLIAAVLNGSVDSTNLASNAVTAAKITDGAVTPAKLTSGAGSSWAWQSYTPTWTGFTIGNGTQNNDYTQIGKTVIVRINVVLGSTSSMSSNPTFTLPVTAISDYTSAAIPAGSAFFEDVGVAGYIAFPTIRTTTTCVIETLSAGGTYLSTAAVSSTAPFTWGTGDKIQATIIYEAA